MIHENVCPRSRVLTSYVQTKSIGPWICVLCQKCSSLTVSSWIACRIVQSQRDQSVFLIWPFLGLIGRWSKVLWWKFSVLLGVQQLLVVRLSSENWYLHLFKVETDIFIFLNENIVIVWHKQVRIHIFRWTLQGI